MEHPKYIADGERLAPNHLARPFSLRFLEFRSYFDACVDELTADCVVAMNGQAVVAHDDSLGQRVRQGREVVGDVTGKRSHSLAVNINLSVLVVMELERNQGELCRVGAERPSNPDVIRAPFGAEHCAGVPGEPNPPFPFVKPESSKLGFSYGGFKKGCVAPKAKAIRSGVTW